MQNYIYFFDEGRKELKHLLGGKGANLAEMKRIGLPVPAGFTVTTAACLAYFNAKQTMPPTLKAALPLAIERLEQETAKQLVGTTRPLLLSVRSGSVHSMPGMMDTILNLGLTDQSVLILANETNNPRFAFDCYRRLIQMFGNVVMGISSALFEEALTALKTEQQRARDTDLTSDDLQQLITTYKTIYRTQTGKDFPQDPLQQLMLAIEAVFDSWYNPRALTYRQLHHLADDLGTAVTIQEMVFGNMGDTSATGVCFTRNPSTGANEIFGEFLLNAQGEDVVAGIRTPLPMQSLQHIMPSLYATFSERIQLLETHYKDMQDVEFTIEKGQLYFLQTRNGKRTAAAQIHLLMTFLDEGLLTAAEVIERLSYDDIEAALHDTFNTAAIEALTPFAIGLPASPGAATGQLYFSATAAQAAAEHNIPVILARQETSPEDIAGMIASEAIITSRGGMTSHAAVVARGMGTACVCGCHTLLIDEVEKTLHYDNGILTEGDWLSVDGSTGKLYPQKIPLSPAVITPSFKRLMQVLSKRTHISVRANADTATDFAQALQFEASGIGLTRTEHMFFSPERLLEMRRLILATTAAERLVALNELEPHQTADFSALFRTAGSRPVTIRLLDPPLHEFLPTQLSEQQQLATQLNISPLLLTERLAALKESNPMMGHRGVRLAISYPAIYKMQVQAIVKSALQLQAEGITVTPEIMIPLIGSEAELNWMRHFLEQAIDEVLTDANKQLTYTIGTMIELPRACLIAGKLATTADFFSFGTNDLTQMVYGFSRDDSAGFLPEYIAKQLLPVDPFQTIDKDGVGQLMQQAILAAKATKPGIKIGVCGELGGEPLSVAYFEKIGVDYVSCSPYRVPLAKLALAKAALLNRTVN
ncbi:pyruvate, phosphate dikinase [Brochothrix campestris]|uniref:Pyruvate, phosphate dikinase n=1 Tax=Brochothrix campestris FSL F6-1037 TaxID=1265861 RepID=W7D234_9LIST|nr:pyruvate, phosphate dikinase [Brochothrix campestris]EUJ42006.1 pyruvate phosphate dikinase [Brochothrix campestris FSL F6-1037]